MKTIRMKRTYFVEGIRRRAGDLVSCQPHVAQGLVDEGMADYVEPQEPARRNAQPVSPNRMKFASLVKALDPHADDFAEQVAGLQDEYQKREGLVRELVRAYTTGPVEDLVPTLLGPETEHTGALDDAVRAAIERFVVDRF